VGGKGLDDPLFVNTQTRIFTSASLLYSVVTNLNLQHLLARQSGEPDWSLDRTFMALSQKVGVTHKSGTSLFAVSVKNADPDVAARIVNTIVGRFREQRLQDWKKHFQPSDRELRADEGDAILALARPSPHTVVGTKLEIFSLWVFGGTLLALMAGGAGALRAFQIRRLSDRNSTPP
jgi:hypothetical protein